MYLQCSKLEIIIVYNSNDYKNIKIQYKDKSKRKKSNRYFNQHHKNLGLLYKYVFNISCVFIAWLTAVIFSGFPLFNCFFLGSVAIFPAPFLLIRDIAYR